MKNYIFMAIVLVMALSTNAQYVSDLELYSEQHPNATARSLGVANAWGAMGGDYASTSFNPAGLGDFRRSDFSLSIGMQQTNTKANLNQSGYSDNSANRKLRLDHISYVQPLEGDAVFSIGYSRSATYNQSFFAQDNSKGSMTDYLVADARQANGGNLNGYYAGLASQVGAIYIDNETKVYSSDYRATDVINKDYLVRKKGGLSEVSLGLATRLSQYFSLGGSLNLPLGSFDRTRTYTQDYTEGNFTNNLKFSEKLNSSIQGANIKIGALIKPIKNTRIGLAAHSPSVLEVEEKFSTEMEYSYQTSTENFAQSGNSPDGTFEYQLITPWKGIASIGQIFKVNDIYGFVNAEAEYVGYETAEFDLSFNDDSIENTEFETALNRAVKANLKSYANYKLGAEVGKSHIRLRSGINLLGNPRNSDLKLAYSMGLGYNSDRFFVDIAYYNRESRGSEPPYQSASIDNNPTLTTSSNIHRMMLTFGMRM